MNRPALSGQLGLLVRAAPGAFRHDPVFRLAAIGAVLALLMLFGRLGGRVGAVPPPAPPSASLGATYGDRSGSAASPTASVSAGSIAPSRSLNGLTVRQDPNAPADPFGTLGTAQPHRKAPDAQP